MTKNPLLPFLVAIFLAGNALSSVTPGHSQNAGRVSKGAKAKHRPPTLLVEDELTLQEKEELAEGFRAAYNLAAAPEIAAIDPIALNVTRYGASAKGVIVKEKEGELYLDTTPCEPVLRKKQMYTFNSPYKKDEADEITCPKSAVKIKMTKITQTSRRPLEN